MNWCKFLSIQRNNFIHKLKKFANYALSQSSVYLIRSKLKQLMIIFIKRIQKITTRVW